jgi:hypothetical protein
MSPSECHPPRRGMRGTPASRPRWGTLVIGSASRSLAASTPDIADRSTARKGRVARRKPSASRNPRASVRHLGPVPADPGGEPRARPLRGGGCADIYPGEREGPLTSSPRGGPGLGTCHGAYLNLKGCNWSAMIMPRGCCRPEAIAAPAHAGPPHLLALGRLATGLGDWRDQDRTRGSSITRSSVQAAAIQYRCPGVHCSRRGLRSD